MKKNNIWETIKNGLKKAVMFVVNVLLFIPRFLINGIKGFFNKEEAESEELDEEFDDNAEEPKQEETVQATVEEEKSESTEEPVAKAKEKSEAEKPVAKASSKEEPKQEETKEVSAEVVDTKSNKALVETKAIVVDTKEESNNFPIFAESDKKTAKIEYSFVEHYNNALRAYGKNLWADGATNMQKFARGYLDAIASKESISAPKVVSERYPQIIDALLIKPLISPEEAQQLREFLRRGVPMQTAAVEPGIKAAFAMIESYKQHYYPEWCKAKAEEMAKANIQTGSGVVA